jgi:hypothetical protein
VDNRDKPLLRFALISAPHHSECSGQARMSEKSNSGEDVSGGEPPTLILSRHPMWTRRSPQQRDEHKCQKPANLNIML